MKRTFRREVSSLLVAFGLFPCVACVAQTSQPPPSASPSAAVEAPGGDRLTPTELEELLGSIALYPDPLLANVLAAAVYPNEVADAAKFVAFGGKAEEIDSRSWEDPVKAIAKIPEVIKMMGDYPEWTVALGQAYLIQAKDVMDVVQTLRKQAQSSGALKSSPQQNVVVEDQVVYVKPADPEIIYVPSYNPSVVYVDHYDNDAAVAGVVGFGVGVATGLILANNLDCDWHGGCVGYGWHGGGGHNDINIEGDVNIGNRNTNVNRENTRNTANVGNRVGNEGNAFAPNKSKPLATSQQNQLSQFKGGGTAANRAQVPGGRRGTADAANRTAGARAQPAARSGQPAARSSAGPTARPTTPRQSPSGATRTPRTPPKQQSAYSGGSSTRAESQRGAASRSKSSSGASRSAPSRSSGGGSRGAGGRSGGGRGGGGRGR